MDLTTRKNHLEYVSPYGYTPSFAPGITYLVLFGIVTLVHVFLGFRYKYWIVFVTLVPGGILEIVGWGGRLWSHYHVLNSNPFIMQICTLILGPAFFSAWAYTILGYCITRLGNAYSLLKPQLYLAVFVTADIISLILQAIGGGKAAVAAKLGTDTSMATKIMLAGILFQLGTMTIFSVLALDFIIRVVTQRPYARRARKASSTSASSPEMTDNTLPADPEKNNSNKSATSAGNTDGASAVAGRSLRRVEYLLAAVAFASLMIYIRGIYRSIELAQGWKGYVITHEAYFIWLDGLPMILCMICFAVGHPGWLLSPRRGWREA